MTRNTRWKGIGTAQELWQRSAPKKSAMSGTEERRLLRQRSSRDMKAIPSEERAITGDRWLISAGIVTAIGSAAFAVIMISQNSSQETFKRTEYQGTSGPPHRVRSNQPQAHANNSDHGSREDRKIDYAVTSSISIKNVKTAEQGTSLESAIGGSIASSGANASNIYSLVFVHKDAALLKGDRGFYVAKRGTMLPGAGKVLSIERLGDMWIVVTPTQTVLEARNGSR